MAVKTAQTRSRAFKACQRCNQKKIKCDAAQTGLPCTRCRVDGAEDCAFISSRRGTYRRRLSHPPTRPNLGEATGTGSLSSDPEVDVGTPCEEPGRSNPLAMRFENFLKQGARDADEGLLGKYGLVLLGDSSPLTFALKELQPENRDRPEVSSSKDTQDSRMSSSATLSVPNVDDHSVSAPTPVGGNSSLTKRSAHPSHLSAADLAYLQAKGALSPPKPECLNALIEAFIDKFYPLCSIVDKVQFLKQHESRTLPWILLQATCLIGTAYCDPVVLKKAGFKSRSAARRCFYDKAKVLYDVGYEPNSVVLLQAIVMMTFWGPDMKSYWNPCSWVGVAVTIAESLGIHRSTGLVTSLQDKVLLRRLWWMIAVRDVYCGTLLGRPFRVNMSHADAQMLSSADFDLGESTRNNECELSALYQVQLARLSLILRRIVNARFNIGLDSTTPQLLHDLLCQWRSELPPTISWPDQGGSTSIFAECLKILYHHHLILIYLPRGESTGLAGLPDDHSATTPTSEVADGAAQTIASTALHLMTRSIVHSLPQEVFPAFFVAGIVFFRLIRSSSQPLVAQLGHSALDNCQIVLNEVRDCWDPAFWGLRIFEFLLAGLKKSSNLSAPTRDNTTSSTHAEIEQAGRSMDGVLKDGVVNTDVPDSFSWHNSFEMGSAIHSLRNAAQADITLTTQLHDHFLDQDDYFMTSAFTDQGDIFDLSQF
ncbi:hypothetical protein LTR10_021681 [Elasticomyces elasticus]|uniref:Zn(2)-C6 fungal-type domain-containing protein n=1 Tax=Exophiala sideris TaxID=1016849 RepID=A0ABR0IVE9_9EURO|nr:hypothetical protein LTR10_021681 [Elasticomyces elasticus]KAK5021126.1 hypothetical protein LTS07_011213 [Exophiala sideris]KAK5023737.1 hypothetical protein LTR13_011115 [Exophiala sideris]KAK5048816.1 hypothetical protein LTR69_011230 [Exophiala sideris]KAK5176323.1 hypothetical protein LTR44_011154 [Eurotiomycetes sp. CCFEE 6388]